MTRDEYMRVKLKYFPEDIILCYHLRPLVAPDGYVYIRIKKGMYGLKQAALLAYNNLKKTMEPYRYYPVVGTVGLWAPKTLPTKFCLCVDYFGVKYFNKQDANHLLQCLSKYYKCTTDWDGKTYCGLNLELHYDQGYVDVAMTNYVQDALKRLYYKHKINPQYSPHAHIPIKYGQKGERQYATAQMFLHPYLQKTHNTFSPSRDRSFIMTGL